MKKIYTEYEGIHVLTDPGDLTDLKLDSCAVARKKGRVYVRSLESLKEKEVEDKRRSGSDPIFGFYGEKVERFLIVNGERRDIRFCDFCKDRLNGITGNCFNRAIKAKGCSFDPVKKPGEFRISLDGWQYLPPSRVNQRSPFKKPWGTNYISFEGKVIERNKRALKIRQNFGAELKKKQEKYCSRCIYQGLCYMDSVKIAERCMVTEEKTQKRCLLRLQKRFGNVEEFLNRLAYAGKEIIHRAGKGNRRTRWIITKPSGRNQFLVRKYYKSSKMTLVSKRKVEKNIIPDALPWKNREKIASLAWYFLEKYCGKDQEAYRGYRGRTIRILWVLPIPRGIEVCYYPYGWGNARPLTKRFESFNDVLRFER